MSKSGSAAAFGKKKRETRDRERQLAQNERLVSFLFLKKKASRGTRAFLGTARSPPRRPFYELCFLHVISKTALSFSLFFLSGGNRGGTSELKKKEQNARVARRHSLGKKERAPSQVLRRNPKKSAASSLLEKRRRQTNLLRTRIPSSHSSPWLMFSARGGGKGEKGKQSIIFGAPRALSRNVRREKFFSNSRH